MRLLLLILLLVAPCWAHPSALDSILLKGEMVVGTTGDYPPFTLKQESSFQGFDIELAELAAQELGVKIKFVTTSWPTLMEDLEAKRFHIAVGGITRTLSRQTRANFSQAVTVIGKCPLVRREDRQRFDSLEAIDQHGIKVGVNPGGTNEKYARQHLQHATIVTVEDNLAIPDMIASGELDLLITDNVEAIRAARVDRRLAAVSAHKPWSVETLGILLGRDDQALVNWLNLFLEQKENDGTLDKLRAKYKLTGSSELP